MEYWVYWVGYPPCYSSLERHVVGFSNVHSYPGAPAVRHNSYGPLEFKCIQYLHTMTMYYGMDLTSQVVFIAYEAI